MSESQPTKAKSANEILPEIYDELKKLAQFKMNQEREGQTLSATALVHEAYIRLSNTELSGQWANPRHYFSTAAEAMRRILIDRARSKKQIRHGGDLDRTELGESKIQVSTKDEDLLAVDEALEELERDDPESAELVKLRYFAGMTWEEISEALGVPNRTIRRRWTYARAWLQERIGKDD